MRRKHKRNLAPCVQRFMIVYTPFLGYATFMPCCSKVTKHSAAVRDFKTYAGVFGCIDCAKGDTELFKTMVANPEKIMALDQKLMQDVISFTGGWDIQYSHKKERVRATPPKKATLETTGLNEPKSECATLQLPEMVFGNPPLVDGRGRERERERERCHPVPSPLCVMGPCTLSSASAKCLEENVVIETT